MAETREDFQEIRAAAKAKEDKEIQEAQEARRKESGRGEPRVVFTKIAGEGIPYLPEDAPAAQDAQAFRKVQLGIVENSPEEVEKVGLPHPDTQTVPESQEEVEPSTELVFTNDTKSLPKGAAGAKIADGVFEIVKGTSNVDAEPDAKSTSRSPKTVTAVKSEGTHPVRLEDDTHTT